MKFRATLTERGIRALSKAFLPTLDRFGKAVQVVLTPSDVHFIQTPQEADGAQLTITFNVDVLFAPDNLRIVSRHHNTIGFGADLALLSKALTSAVANAPDSVDVKLTQKAVPLPLPPSGAGDDAQQQQQPETESKPFLCFTSRGMSLNLVQDLPVSKPCTASELNTLTGMAATPQLCPFYLDLKPVQPRLAAALDRTKALSSVVHVALCKTGDLHIQVAESSVMLGAQFEGLAVLPQDAASGPEAINRQQTAEQQLHQALEAGEAIDVHMSVKHLLKVMNVSNLSQPSQILIGIPEGGAYVHVMYVFRNPAGDAPFDESISVNFKLPVREED